LALYFALRLINKSALTELMFRVFSFINTTYECMYATLADLFFSLMNRQPKRIRPLLFLLWTSSSW